MPAPDFTMDDLLVMLQTQDATSGDAGVTVGELAQALGRGRDWVRLRLYGLQQQGLLECGHKQIVTLDGRRTPVPTYRLKGKQDK